MDWAAAAAVIAGVGVLVTFAQAVIAELSRRDQRIRNMTGSTIRRGPRQADLDRALKAVMDAGLHVRSLKINADGSFEVTIDEDRGESGANSQPNSWGGLLTGTTETVADALEKRFASTGRVQHDPEVDRALATAAERVNWDRVRSPVGASTLTVAETATALGVPQAVVERAAATGQLERRVSPRVCFTPAALRRSLEGASVRVRRT